MKKLVLVLLVILLSGCAGQWAKVTSSNKNYKDGDFSIALPLDWMVIKYQGDTLVTRDGLRLQRVKVNSRSHDEAFKKLKKESSDSMLPSELAELFIANFKKEYEDGLPSLDIVSNELTEVDGNKSFSLVYQFKNEDGLVYQGVSKGFVTATNFYELTYLAPKQFFYQRDYEVFQKIVTSFSLKK